ncbi:MAG: acyltransferase [Pantoea agglomerans]
MDSPKSEIFHTAAKQTLSSPTKILNLNIEVGRSLAIISVIVVHMSMGYFNNKLLIGTSDWYISNLFYSITRFCVPFFLITTAYIYHIDAEQIRKPLIYKFKRLIIPFLFWSVAYYFYTGYVSNEKDIVSFIKMMITSGTAFHLWFFYSFFFYLISVPAFKIIYDNMTEKNYNFILYFLTIFLIVIPSLANYFGIDNGIIPSFDGNKIKPDFIIYSAITPWAMNKFCNASSNKLLLIFITSCAINFIATSIISNKNGQPYETAYSYTNLLVLIGSYSLFLYVTKLKRSFSLKEEKLIITVGRSSFGIYLAHWMVYITLDNAGFFIHRSALPSIIFDSLLLLTATILLIQLMLKTPYLKKLI